MSRVVARFTYGGDNQSQGRIIVDDSCYLVEFLSPTVGWIKAQWLFQEAVVALKSLPDNPRDAQWLLEAMN